MTSVRCCLLWLLVTQLLMTSGSGTGPLMSSDDVPDSQFSCMADYFQTKQRQRIDIYVEVPFTGELLAITFALLDIW